MTILARPQVAQHICSYQFPAGVVAVLVIDLQHPKPVPDGESRHHYQDAPSESLAVGMPEGFDGLHPIIIAITVVLPVPVGS
jgi:hypothetical protein